MDVLITKVQLRIEHESGAGHELHWHEVVEVRGQMVFPGAQSQPVFQESEAIAMKVLATDFKDVELRNRFSTHMINYRKLVREWVLAKIRLEKLGQYNADAFYASSITQGLISYLRSQMIWKSGKYSVHIKVTAKEPVLLDAPVLEFILSQDDIDQLQENNDMIQKWMRNACHAGTSDQSAMVETSWHWLHTELACRP
ncbi:hypothetical protein [Pseudoduganella umbonata]|nr:hypothetical protein [Pseudoduganella umbonata]